MGFCVYSTMLRSTQARGGPETLREPEKTDWNKVKIIPIHRLDYFFLIDLAFSAYTINFHKQSFAITKADKRAKVIRPHKTNSIKNKQKNKNKKQNRKQQTVAKTYFKHFASSLLNKMTLFN